jgi:hypothetical protein
MKKNKKKTGIVFMALLIILTMVGLVQAQSYEITWWVVGGGGGTSSGSGHTLRGIIGQLDAGNMSGGEYTLTGGFWSLNPFNMIYLPLIIKN